MMINLVFSAILALQEAIDLLMRMGIVFDNAV